MGYLKQLFLIPDILFWVGLSEKFFTMKDIENRKTVFRISEILLWIFGYFIQFSIDYDKKFLKRLRISCVVWFP